MMEDKVFLQWIYDRLIYKYGEDCRIDYMHKLKSIIEATPPDRLTPNTK